MSKEQLKTVRVKKSTYDKINKMRTTEKGKVSFDAIINWLIGKNK